MTASALLTTDSGGLQEESAALGVLEAGVLRLAGNDPATLEAVLTELLGDETQLSQMRAARNPYGDGLASGRIAQAVAWHFGLAPRPDDWH